MEGIEFLEYVWGKQGEGVAALAFKEHAEHFEEKFVDPHFATSIEPHIETADFATYFCPNLFIERRRREQCLPGRWLWQDLDEVYPDECPVAPTLYWETSPDRYQALWLLKQHVPPAELASMNKALNRACKADKGTWNLTRLLRVPGSYNGKRECQVGPARELALAVV